MYGRDKGALTQTTYSLACVQQLLANRNFISVAAEDLVIMAYQGTDRLKFGIKIFKKHLSSPETEFQSALRVSVAFLMRLVDGGPCHVGAICSLVEHLSEALFRHKDAPWNLIFLLESAVHRVLPMDTHLIRVSLEAGYAASRLQSSGDLKNVRVLMTICSPPWIAFIPENEIAGTVGASLPASVGSDNTNILDAADTTSANNSADNPFR